MVALSARAVCGHGQGRVAPAAAGPASTRCAPCPLAPTPALVPTCTTCLSYCREQARRARPGRRVRRQCRTTRSWTAESASSAEVLLRDDGGVGLDVMCRSVGVSKAGQTARRLVPIRKAQAIPVGMWRHSAGDTHYQPCCLCPASCKRALQAQQVKCEAAAAARVSAVWGILHVWGMLSGS